MSKDLRQKSGQLAHKAILELLEKNDNSPTRVGELIGVNKGLVCRVRDGGYSPTVCRALGLPVVRKVQMPVCSECGKVHDIKATCSHVRRQAPARRRKAADLSPTAWGVVQSKALDEIAENLGGGTWSQFVTAWANNVIEGWPVEKLEREVRNAVIGDVPEW